MKAQLIERYGTISDVKLKEVDAPAQDAGELLVRVKSAALNPADLKVITGRDGGRFIHSSKSPIRLGFDFSGVVEALGEGVSGFAAGDEVFGFLPYSTKTRQGSFADYVAVGEKTVAKKPASLTHTEAATVATAASTALQAMVEVGGVGKGAKVLVNGATGGVGSYAVQIAKSLGAEVTGTCSAASLDYLSSLGADHVLDYRKTALDRLGGKFDVVLDAVSNSSFAASAPILAPRGIYITLLPSPGLVTGKILSLFSSRKCAMIVVRSRTETLTRIGGMIEDGAITVAVAASYPLSHLRDALLVFKEGGVKGKIGIVVEE